MSFDRRGAIAKLHVAKKQLALTDDSYRAILHRVAGITSAREATEVQLLALLKEMRRFGFQDRPNIATAPAHVRKVFAMWRDLAPLLTDANEAALRGFVRRQTGIERPEWLDGKQAAKVIEGLKAWHARLATRRGTDAVEG